MLTYDKLENLKIKRNKMMLPKNKAQRTKGNLIYLCSPDIQSSITTLNNMNIRGRMYYQAYYIERKYRLTLFNKSKIQKIESSEVYSEILEKCKLITRTYKSITQYKNFNVFVDLFRYNDLFINMSSDLSKNLEKLETSSSGSPIQNGSRIMNNYIKMIQDIDTQFTATYENKILLIDLNAYNIDNKSNDLFKMRFMNNPLSIFIQLLSRDIETFKSLSFEILLVKGNNFIKIIPKECDNHSLSKLKENIRKMSQSKGVNVTDDILLLHDEETKDVLKDEQNDLDLEVDEKMVNTIISKINKNNTVSDIAGYSFTGKYEKDIPEIIEKNVEKVVKDVSKDDEDVDEVEIAEKVEDNLNNDEEFLKKLEMVKTDKIADIDSPYNLKRNKMLAEKQNDVKVGDKTIKEILKELEDKTIEPKELKINTKNKNMVKLKSVNFEKDYNKKLMDKDTIAIVNFLSNLSVPVYVLDIKKENTSDSFNKKNTWTIKLESADRQRHVLKFDLPIFIHDKFMYLGGNKKIITKQLMLKPISKTGPSTVQLCSNYNKIFMTRSGTKVSPKVERLKKILMLYENKKTVNIKKGDNTLPNLRFKTTVEYDELGSYFFKIKICSCIFYFNQDDIRTIIKKNGLKFDDSNEDIIPVGIDKDEVLLLDTNKDKLIKYNKSVPDFIIDKFSEKFSEFGTEMNKMTTGTKFIYTRAKIMKKNIPLILLLSYLEGLTTVLKKSKMKFRFSDKREQLSNSDKNDKGIIEFADGYLIFDRYPMSNSLLLNGLSVIPTKAYNYSDFDNKETYLDLFDDLVGMRMIVNAFDNFYNLFIDPITLEVLKDLKLPTSFVELVLYANTLLEDNAYVRENNMSLYRLRSNEMVNAYLYKAISNAYENYRLSYGNKNPQKISFPQDKVLKDLLTSQILADYDILNPVLEAEKTRAVSFKGPSGMNLSQAYTLDKRSYDKTMKGILSISSPPSGQVGVVRQLSTDANITSPRGYLKIAQDEEKELNTTNLFSPAELLTPMCAQRDE